MMWYYSLVQEMIMNQEWIKENGDNWAAGRIECSDSESSFGYANREYPIMIDRKDWNDFADFLNDFSSTSLQTLDQLIQSSKLPIVRFKHESSV